MAGLNAMLGDVVIALASLIPLLVVAYGIGAFRTGCHIRRQKKDPYVSYTRLGRHWPLALAACHAAVILIAMVMFYNGWFLTDIPFDCFYGPFFWPSGPLVYLVAHDVQHYSERYFFSPDGGIQVCWNLVPGTVCLVLGGFQWWAVGKITLLFERRQISAMETAGSMATVRPAFKPDRNSSDP